MIDKIGRLPSKVLVCGRFHIHGCHSDDIVADVAILGGEELGMLMPVSNEIERMLKRRDNLDPTDKERVLAHINRCKDEGYIGVLAQLMENTFQEDLSSWRYGFSYKFDTKNNKHVRSLVMMLPDPPEPHDDWMLRRMICHLEDYHRNGGFDHFDVAPKHGPNAFTRRK